MNTATRNLQHLAPLIKWAMHKVRIAHWCHYLPLLVHRYYCSSFYCTKQFVPGTAFLNELRRNIFFARDIHVKIYLLWIVCEQHVISLAVVEVKNPAPTLTTNTLMIGELTHFTHRIEKLVFLAQYSLFYSIPLSKSFSIVMPLCILSVHVTINVHYYVWMTSACFHFNLYR